MIYQHNLQRVKPRQLGKAKGNTAKVFPEALPTCLSELAATIPQQPHGVTSFQPHGRRRRKYMLGLGCGVYGTAGAIPLSEERLTNTTCSE